MCTLVNIRGIPKYTGRMFMYSYFQYKISLCTILFETNVLAIVFRIEKFEILGGPLDGIVTVIMTRRNDVFYHDVI